MEAEEAQLPETNADVSGFQLAVWKAMTDHFQAGLNVGNCCSCLAFPNMALDTIQERAGDPSRRRCKIQPMPDDQPVPDDADMMGHALAPAHWHLLDPPHLGDNGTPISLSSTTAGSSAVPHPLGHFVFRLAHENVYNIKRPYANETRGPRAGEVAVTMHEILGIDEADGDLRRLDVALDPVHVVGGIGFPAFLMALPKDITLQEAASFMLEYSVNSQISLVSDSRVLGYSVGAVTSIFERLVNANAIPISHDVSDVRP